MEVKNRVLMFFLLSFLFISASTASKNSYIVYFGGHPQGLVSVHTRELRQESHYEFLGSIIGNKEKAREAIFYSYTDYINGFAATLDDAEVEEISKRPGVISVIPNTARKLHTTRSWGFLGQEKNGKPLDGSLSKKARFGEDTIIATLDSGVWFDSLSFDDKTMGSIPSKWKGKCEPGVTCNRKLIGARMFNKGYLREVKHIDPKLNTPLDLEGHGTHTTSTAGGSFVPNASLYGNANGTARGGSPMARVASYKVCWPETATGGGCYDADILAAFEAAIHDGVDVLSVSLGSRFALPYFQDATAIGSFHAVKKGIAVVCSAGNSGPIPGIIDNLAPWIFTVAASSVDRSFSQYLHLGNKHRIEGLSFTAKGLEGFKPMISSVDAVASNSTIKNARLCLPGSLDPKKVKGKIVICLRGIDARTYKGKEVLRAGGIGMVIANAVTTDDHLYRDNHVLPAIQIHYSDGVAVFSYLNSTKTPYGSISRTKTNIGSKPTPVMASFSSQGPNPLTPGILKPDITAPGVDILAAYTGAAVPSGVAPNDTARVPFDFMSGTSMSCPHVAGIVGLMKTLYPDWSPSAIKSAIMTTAMTVDNTRHSIKNNSLAKATPFNYGSGHLHPNRAMYPGLVYDLTPTDYLDFMCSLGYNSSQVATFSERPYSCPSKTPRVEDLNYPSIVIPKLVGSTSVTRVLKNVGLPGTYKAYVKAPRGVSVSVDPRKLKFEKVGEEKKFKVTMRARSGVHVGKYAFGTLRWSDGNRHHVRSPIVVKVGK